MLHVHSILIAAVALSSLAALTTVTEAKAALLDVSSIALPFNDLLPPLIESETSSNDIAATTVVSEDDDKPTTIEPTKGTTTTSTTTTTRKPTAAIDKSNGTKLGAKIVTVSATQSTVLPLPFNDLLPPLLEPIVSNDVPAALNFAEETRVATTILRMTTRQPLSAPSQSATSLAYKFPNTNTARPSIRSRVASLGAAVKPSRYEVTKDTPKKYYKKPSQQAKIAPSYAQAPVEFRPETVRQYLENFHHTTYRPRKANLPTLTPFPRHLK